MISSQKISFLYLKVLTLLFLALIIKGWNIGETDIGGDECFSVYNAQLSISEIISWLSKGNNPPLWEILLHFWIKLFGISEVAIRSLSLLFSVSTVIPIFFIGERFLGKNVGFYAALLFIFSSFSLFLSHDARVYSLVGFLAAYSVYYYLKLLKDKVIISSLVILTIINGLILYSHYLSVWIIIIQVLLFIIIKSIREHLGLKYLYHLVCLFLLFLPFISVIITRILDSGTKGTWVQQSNGIESLYFILVDFFNEPVVAVIAIAFFLFGLIFNVIKKKINEINLVLNLMIWIPLVVSFVLSFKVGFFLNRYFYFLLPLLHLSLANIVFSVKVKKLKYVIILVPILAMMFSFEISTKGMIHSGNHKEIKPLAQKVKSLIENGSSIIYLSPVWFDKELVYYLDKNIFTTYFDEYESETVFKKPLNKLNVFPIYNTVELKTSINQIQIVFVDNNRSSSSDNEILKALELKYILINQENFNGVKVYTFVNKFIHN